MMRGSRDRDQLRIIFAVLIVAVLSSCGGGSSTNNQVSTGNQLVWDQGNWDQADWK